MFDFKINVYYATRGFSSMIAISLLTVLSLHICSKIEVNYLKIIFLVFTILSVLSISIYFSTAKLKLTIDRNSIYFDWIRPFVFSNSRIDPINITEIKTLVIDDDKLSRIITKDRNIVINNIRPLNKEFQTYLDQLAQTVIENGGKIINSPYIWKAKGYYDLSFKITMILLGSTAFFISRLWILWGFNSLLLLFIPVISFLIHLKLRIKEKNRR